MTNMDIEVHDLKVILPNEKVLFSIPRFSLPTGRHVLISGLSGSGKTTFLHVLAGLLPPSSGRVVIGTTEVQTLSENERCELRRKTMGVIFQKLNLLDHLTVAENIHLVASRGLEEAASRVRLDLKLHERCSYLSTGEQQRVAVARVLAQKPSLILADEPTSSLDAFNTELVMKSLKQAASGKTMIVVSHDERIEKYFDEVISFQELTR